tara:strand:+ start:102891 stop:104300 length:1410 start_codon:yes stop_codon:yes gene_type:complete
MSDKAYDLVVIGAGPGGYTGAIRAAQLGLKVAIIDKRGALGGTCLNVGCIPSKALLESSEHFIAAQHELADHGVDTSGVKLNLKKMMERKNAIVKELTDGIDYLMNKNKIETFIGTGKVLDKNTVEVSLNDGGSEKLTASNIMLATGSVPNHLPFLPVDEKSVVTSTGALDLEKVPDHLIVIGGGVIGLELGSVWKRLGAKVTVIEFTNAIAAGMDTKIAKRFQAVLKKQGMEFLMESKVVEANTESQPMKVKYENLKTGETSEIEGDVVLVSTGRRPYSEGLGLENVGITPNQRGQVEVNHSFQTNVPNIYAIGDLIPGPMLAHKAEEEGVAVAEIVSGQSGHVNYLTVPGIVYTWPELASVGYTEDQLKEQNIPYNVGTFPFSPNGRAKAMGHTEGQAKILAHKESDKILGVHILGPRAGDLIGEAVVAMEFGGSAEDLARSFHAHPTLSEVVREAALAVDKRARQM